MSGVHRIVTQENKGLEQVTNDDLREEGVADENSDEGNGEDK